MCLNLSGGCIGQHAITLINDTNDGFKYISNDKLKTVESLDEILVKESEWIDCEITEYGFVPAGSSYVWVDDFE
jgi:hypothetical protein